MLRFMHFILKIFAVKILLQGKFLPINFRTKSTFICATKLAVYFENKMLRKNADEDKLKVVPD